MKTLARISHSTLRKLTSFGVPTFLLLVFFLSGTATNLFEFLVRQASSNTLPNLSCTSPSADPPSPGWGPCASSNEAQFDRILWVVTDALPRVYADPLFTHFRAHGVGYSVVVPGLKLSHSIFSAHFTGQSDVAFWMRKQLVGDTLFDTLLRGGYKMWWLGKRLSLMALLGPEREEALDETTYADEYVATRIHPLLFQSPTHTLNILDEMVAHNRSMYAYSALYDTKMHQFGAESELCQSMVKQFIEEAKILRDWVHKHPNYLLVFGSDHGVDGFGNLLHGSTMPGNDGFLLFYNPRLVPQPDSRIDVVDVAPTVAKMLRGVDIPANSVGRAQGHFGPFHDQFYPSVLLENAWQLARVAGFQEHKPVVDVTQLSAQSTVEDLSAAVDALKDQVWGSSHVSSFTALINLCCMGAATLFLIFHYNRSIFALTSSSVQRLLILVALSVAGAYPMWSIAFFLMRRGDLAYDTVLAAEVTCTILSLALVVWLSNLRDYENIKRVALNCLINLALSSHVMEWRWTVELVGYWFPSVLCYVIAVLFLFKIEGSELVLSKSHILSTVRQNTQLRYCLVVLCAMALVESTRSFTWLFFIFGFHPVALFVYFALIWMMFSSVWRISTAPEPIANATNDITRVSGPLGLGASTILLAFWLLYRSSYHRLVVLLVSYQLYSLLGPIISDMSALAVSESTKVHFNHSPEIAYQGSVALMLSQGFFSFGVVLRERFDVNVDPFAGKVGMSNYDAHPYISASLMAFSKTFPFFLVTVAMWFAQYARSPTGAMKPPSQSMAEIGGGDVPRMHMVLLLGSANVAFFLITWRYWMSSKLSEVLFSSVIFGLSASGYAFLCLIRLLGLWARRRGLVVAATAAARRHLAQRGVEEV